jgi:16S rRNA (uracil1498-N3)-methyltransferase
VDQYFYSEDIFDSFILLPEDEAHHAIKVLRKKVGDTILVVDGRGGRYESVFENENSKDCRLKIIKKINDIEEFNSIVHIAIAPPKSHDRIEWFIEKSIEIGVNEISFIQTSNSERKTIKIQRVRKYAIAAMKQSLKARLPVINDMEYISNFLLKCKNKQKFIAHLDKKNSSDLFNSVKKSVDCCVLIGPEGDFNSLEINESIENGFKPVNLGPNRLRTETAGLAACHILNLVNQK